MQVSIFVISSKNAHQQIREFLGLWLSKEAAFFLTFFVCIRPICCLRTGVCQDINSQTIHLIIDEEEAGTHGRINPTVRAGLWGFRGARSICRRARGCCRPHVCLVRQHWTVRRLGTKCEAHVVDGQVSSWAGAVAVRGLDHQLVRVERRLEPLPRGEICVHSRA